MGRWLDESVRLVDDPYGEAFSDGMPSMWLAQKLEGAGMPMLKVPGMLPWVLYMQVRTRVIDDALEAFVAAGGTQIVILGAGYDCRALRLGLAERGVRVFEVDHPATQSHKKGTLARIGAKSPATYVTWHFEERPMSELVGALGAAGLDLALPVFTIWEGVTMYLTEPAIDASLRAIRSWSAGTGSRLAMTYFAKSRLTKPSVTTRAVKAIVARVGEPWRWGWVPSELPGYLSARGFGVVRDVAMSDAAAELLPAKLARFVSNPDRRTMLASAPESIAVAS